VNHAASALSDSVAPMEQAFLMVTSGVLKGARMKLEMDRTYSVGSDENSEVVLRGAVSDGSTMQIALSAEGVGVTEYNKTKLLSFHDELSFGSARFFIVQSDVQSSLTLQTSNRSVPSEVKHNIVDAGLANSNTAELNSSARRFVRPILYAAAIAAAGIAISALVLEPADTQHKPVPEIATIESALDANGLGHLQVNRSQNSTVLAGFVQTRQQALTLANLLADRNEPLINRVQVDAEIQEQIENVLRVNGVAGLVEAMGNGVFEAYTQLSPGSKLDGLQSLIERDVPSVTSFTVNNQLPEQPADLAPDSLPVEPKADFVQLDSGKRVVLVNSDNPAYLVTEDESRYFVGSILPGGYRITDILDGRVLLDKQGETTELKF